ncbi:KxYKxGKxW signal peptide domain-containing protein [Lacticaseibacillus pantheris]|uniref:KxYKxGKxW signal peptide domain-containing protein n=1 Tax=Lacticaseibacillus pantheris TaxID=171523 RepID=UPI0009EBC33C
MKIRGTRSYERLETDTKQRYKMYKDGRHWVYAGLLTTFFCFGSSSWRRGTVR